MMQPSPTNLPKQKHKFKAGSFVQLLKLASPHRTEFFTAMLALFLGSAINLVFPEIIRRSLDPKLFPAVLENLPLLMAGLVLLFTLQGAAFYIRSNLFGRIGQKVVAEIRAKLFTALIRQSVSFFDHNRSGDLVSRINSDAALVQDAVSLRLSVILRYGVQVVFGVVLMTWMSWKMSLAIVASVGLMVLVSSIFIRRLRRASLNYQDAVARLSSLAGECFGAARIVRSLAAESQLETVFAEQNATGAISARSSGLERSRISAAFTSGASLFLNLLLLGVLWFGIYLVVGNELRMNDLAAFVLYGAIVGVSFTFLVSSYSELVQGLAGLERVFELIQTDNSSGASSDEQASGSYSALGPKVSLTDLTFSYPTRADVLVLKHLTFSCEGGKVTAIVGPSGAGKSSIVQLLLGFYLPTSGFIQLDGIAVDQISKPNLYRLIAWVPQEPHLFGFSIEENLLLGNTMVTAQELPTITKDWEFLNFIEALPEGLHTVLGEQGTQLSGGQRQRIAIARAVLRKPSLLVLDEATAGLDSGSEELVVQVIRRYLPDATVILISHRLATVKGADAVYVLEDGCISQEGTHESLRASPGLYQQYVGRQSLG
jgi:ABC-type multidrug transport system fused ATPase/permease subunit